MATKKTKRAPKKEPTHRVPADEDAATELVLYIENTSDLSLDGPSGQGRSILLNLLRKYRKGTYDPKLALRLLEYLTESGAKRYAKEMGSSEKEWSTMFTPATRHEAARQLEESFRNSAEHGEYDHVDTRIGVHENTVEAHRPERSMYPSSPSGQYVLSRDGKEVMRGTEQEIWQWMHRNHSYSIDHAIRYEGYSIAPVEGEGRNREVDASRSKRDIKVGDTVRFTKKFLQNTGQYTGHDANGRWEVLEVRGSYAFVNQPSDTSYFTPTELQADPMLKWRAINVGNLEIA